MLQSDLNSSNLKNGKIVKHAEQRIERHLGDMWLRTRSLEIGKHQKQEIPRHMQY